MGKQGSLFENVQRFDAFAKTLDDFRIRTKTGALVTIISSIIMVMLLISEFRDYMKVSIQPQLIVDRARKDRLNIELNITLPKIPCYVLGIHVMDASGEEQSDTSHDIVKVRLSPDGHVIEKEQENVLGDSTTGAAKSVQGLVKAKDPNYCGDCYGGEKPPSGCCNTCEEVRDAYMRKGWSFTNTDKIEQCVKEHWSEKMQAQEKEGCNLHGRLGVSKVAGNFHLALGRTFSSSGAHVHDLMPYLSRQYDFSHEIHELRFGEKINDVINPLDGQSKDVYTHDCPEDTCDYQYFIKVVGTKAVYLNGTTIHTNQYAATQHAQPASGSLPGLFFNYDISPMVIIYTETHRSFLTFLTSVCAVVGGVFTVASLIDAFIYNADRALRQKVELGKDR
ncbi:serologically defined breast cancer antigen NY-BR-84 [Syncephalis plumigaleata]|nr:serologically defined breast cancer antigen NY-BR-84 [Syncephalis plumigaleata]